MANKIYVAVKCDVKEMSIEKIDKDKVKKAMTAAMSKVIDNSSKYTTKTRANDGFDLSATVTRLKHDKEPDHQKIEGKIALICLKSGSTIKAFSGESNGATESSKDNQDDAEFLLGDICTKAMPKVID